MKFVQKLELLGQVSDMKNRTHALRARTSANIASAAHSVEENPGLTISRRSLELCISQATLHRILWPELDDMDVDDIYFQQDGATCRYRRNRAPNVRKCNGKFHQKSMVLQM